MGTRRRSYIDRILGDARGVGFTLGNRAAHHCLTFSNLREVLFTNEGNTHG